MRYPPKFGVALVDVGVDELVETAHAAEAAGFASLWLGDHIIVPYDLSTAHPSDADTRSAEDQGFQPRVSPTAKLLDPLVALAAVVSVTTRIHVGTGVLVLTMRHPLATARSVASLAEISAGRLMLGLGSGWLREEFDALDIPFDERGSRYDESLEILRLALRGGKFEHDGRHFSFGPVQVVDQPIDLPIVLGGNSDHALRRAAGFADAWFASGTPAFEEAARLRNRLEEFWHANDRLDMVETLVRVPRVDGGEVDRYREAGFDHLLFWAQEICKDTEDRRLAFQRAAETLGIERTNIDHIVPIQET